MNEMLLERCLSSGFFSKRLYMLKRSNKRYITQRIGDLKENKCHDRMFFKIIIKFAL